MTAKAQTPADQIKTEIAERVDNEVSLKIEVAADMVAQYFNDTYKKLSRDVVIPGFRRGKAPRMLIKSRLGAENINQAVLEELLPVVVETAVERHEFQLMGQPDLDYQEPEEGAAFTIEATLPLRPEVTLGPYKGLKVKALKEPVAEDGVDKAIERLRERNVELEDTELGCDNGHVLTINYRIVNAELHPELDPKLLSGEELVAELGAEGWIPGLEDKVKGMKAGDKDIFDIEYPDDFMTEPLRGKTLKMEIEIVKVQEKKLPEVDEKFAKSVAGVETTVDELKARIAESLESNNTQAHLERAREKAVDYVLGASEVEIPKKMVEREAEFLESNFVEQLQWQQQQTLEEHAAGRDMTVDQVRDDFKDRAYRNVKLGFIIDEIVKDEQVEVTQDEISNEISRIIQGYGLDRQTAAKLFNDEDRISRIQYDLMQKKAVDLIVDAAEIEAVDNESHEAVEPPDEDGSAVEEKSAPEPASEENHATIDETADAPEQAPAPDAEAEK